MLNTSDTSVALPSPEACKFSKAILRDWYIPKVCPIELRVLKCVCMIIAKKSYQNERSCALPFIKWSTGLSLYEDAAGRAKGLKVSYLWELVRLIIGNLERVSISYHCHTGSPWRTSACHLSKLFIFSSERKRLFVVFLSWWGKTLFLAFVAHDAIAQDIWASKSQVQEFGKAELQKLTRRLTRVLDYLSNAVETGNRHKAAMDWLVEHKEVIHQCPLSTFFV